MASPRGSYKGFDGCRSSAGDYDEVFDLPACGGMEEESKGEADELQGESKRGYVQRGRNRSL